ncbi:MAG: hypothetical protein L3J75_11620 [Methylococcaceae bacterium]|nr:hypothetical protein [Methylococcaceae bacterium]
MEELKRANPSMKSEDIHRYAKEFLNSGKEIPIVITAKPDQTLYKIVPKGENVSGYTPYCMSKKQLEAFKENPKSIPDTMGLPKGSEASKYSIYEIKPESGKTPKVFESKVAKTSEGPIKRRGGGEQVIVPNRPDWTTPKKTGGI